MMRLLCIAGLLCVAACDDLDEFATGDDSVFRGKIVGSDSGENAPSFIRQGFASHTQMEVTFDPELAAGFSAAELDSPSAPKAPSPGTLRTYVCPADDDVCETPDRSPGHFDKAALEPIPNLAHDALSQYDFPGGGRIRSYMLGVRFESEADGEIARRHAMTFLSLMETGRIEVRVIAPSVLDPDDNSEVHPALFGVFTLERTRK